VQSIRIWLAGVIRNDAAFVRRGMAIWLQADATLDEFRSLGADGTRRICHTVLAELASWLQDDRPERILRAHAALGGLRARLLARTYLVEYLKQESHFGAKSREEERMVVGLLDAFLAGAAPALQGLAPTLPSPEHADRARTGTEPSEP
jgi:hypothetical protein